MSVTTFIDAIMTHIMFNGMHFALVWTAGSHAPDIGTHWKIVMVHWGME